MGEACRIAGSVCPAHYADETYVIHHTMTMLALAGADVAITVGIILKSSLPAKPEGIAYLRADTTGGMKDDVGQAMSPARYDARQKEHARKHPNAQFRFDVLGHANPGVEPDRLEQYHIKRLGGPTNKSNPNGGLSNRRNQMNEIRYRAAGGDYPDGEVPR